MKVAFSPLPGSWSGEQAPLGLAVVQSRQHHFPIILVWVVHNFKLPIRIPCCINASTKGNDMETSQAHAQPALVPQALL